MDSRGNDVALSPAFSADDDAYTVEVNEGELYTLIVETQEDNISVYDMHNDVELEPSSHGVYTIQYLGGMDDYEISVWNESGRKMVALLPVAAGKIADIKLMEGSAVKELTPSFDYNTKSYSWSGTSKTHRFRYLITPNKKITFMTFNTSGVTTPVTPTELSDGTWQVETGYGSGTFYSTMTVTYEDGGMDTFNFEIKVS